MSEILIQDSKNNKEHLDISVNFLNFTLTLKDIQKNSGLMPGGVDVFGWYKHFVIDWVLNYAPIDADVMKFLMKETPYEWGSLFPIDKELDINKFTFPVVAMICATHHKIPLNIHQTLNRFTSKNIRCDEYIFSVIDSVPNLREILESQKKEKV